MAFKLNRRHFLKLLSLAPLLNFASAAQPRPRLTAQASVTNNILVLVLDTLSARHMSLYGYPRHTTPHLARLAERSIVYHRHYAAANFTSPGTASLLTGTYPWFHRAFNLRGTVTEPYVSQNLFTAFQAAGHYCLAYTHSGYVIRLLNQFRPALDRLKPIEDLLLSKEIYTDEVFGPDANIALTSEELILPSDERLPTSLFLSLVDEARRNLELRRAQTYYGVDFPNGFPEVGNGYLSFRLEDTMDWLIRDLRHTPQPFLAYCHVLPPHEPYRPRREFIGQFKEDGWAPPHKESHYFSQLLPQASLNQRRLAYDQYLAYADAEFGRLYDGLQASGLLDNTTLVVTSDHGQMFERGIHGHITPTLYNPILHIPLLISQPGRTERQDISAPTSAVDVLPTLLHLIGQPPPVWSEGQVMAPFFTDDTLTGRPVFAVEAKVNFKHQPLTAATVALIRKGHKLVGYFGYSGHHDVYELYDWHADPDELHNLYAAEDSLSASLREELLTKINAINQPFIS